MVEGSGVQRYVISSLILLRSTYRETDIVIADKKSDLNIYKERNQGEEEPSCCTTAEKEPASSCCAPSTSCCSPSTSAEKMKSEKEDLAKRVANIDFNEWVSKSSPFRKIISHAVTYFFRLVQHLRS